LRTNSANPSAWQLWQCRHACPIAIELIAHVLVYSTHHYHRTVVAAIQATGGCNPGRLGHYRMTSPTQQPTETTATSLLGVRIIADRVVLRIDGAGGWRSAELSLEQAEAAHAYLGDAIATLRSGASVLPTLSALIAMLRDPTLA
jgi:hypothetical protein